MNVRNYLVLDLDPDSATITIDHHSETKRNITDPVTRQPKEVHALELHVSSVNGVAVSTRYSVVSDNEYAMWAPYLVGQAYKGRAFRITKTGAGFRRQTTLEVLAAP
jgi:hypothetical protein